MSTHTGKKLSSRLWESFSYNYFGPTTIHLQHEVYLWISLILLELSSLESINKQSSFGTMIIGDFQFTGLVAIWLSRFLALRWLVTWDASTSLNPNPAAHWFTSHVMAGQYFDRPSPSFVAKQLGVQHHHGGNIDGRGRISPGGTTFQDCLWPSLVFTGQYIKVWIWYPFLTLTEQLISTLPSTSSARRSQQMGRQQKHQQKNLDRRRGRNISISSISSTGSAPSYYSTYINNVWSTYGPSLQMIIPLATIIFIVWYGILADYTEDLPHSLAMHTQSPVNADSVDNGGVGSASSQSSAVISNKSYGSYKKLIPPTWGQVLFFLSCCGTLLSILLYGRILFPIPDLIAGTNVLKALRNETKQQFTQQQQSAGHTSSKSSRASRIQRDSPDQSWLEHYKSITAENRFRIFCKIALVRIVENIFICLILPRTNFVCRATGHCPNKASHADLVNVLYFVGITAPLRSDGNDATYFSTQSSDIGAAVVTLISIIMVTGSLLLAQATTLNRSFLGVMGHLAGEWMIVDTNANPTVLEGTNPPSPWDPRRRYRKGDLIAEMTAPKFGKTIVYRAATNNPEGRPLDTYLRASHYLFRNELGHPATSRIIVSLSTLQFGFVSIQMFFILANQILYNNINASLLWTLAANLVSVLGTISVAMPRYNEIDIISYELDST